MDAKGEILLLFNNSKLKNGTKAFLEPKLYLFIVKFKGALNPNFLNMTINR